MHVILDAFFSVLLRRTIIYWEEEAPVELRMAQIPKSRLPRGSLLNLTAGCDYLTRFHGSKTGVPGEVQAKCFTGVLVNKYWKFQFSFAFSMRRILKSLCGCFYTQQPLSGSTLRLLSRVYVSQLIPQHPKETDPGLKVA